MIAKFSEKTGEIELDGDGNELLFLARQLLSDNNEVVLSKKNQIRFHTLIF